MTFGKWTMTAAAVLAIGWGLGTDARGEEPSGWKVEVTPYAWLVGIDGDIKIGDREVSLDQSFSDLIEHVDFAGSVLAVVQKERMVVFGQMDYFSLTEDSDLKSDPTVGVDVDIDNTFAVLAAGWQFDSFVKGSTIDVLAGARYAGFDNRLKVSGRDSRSANTDLYDPIVMLRPSFPILPSKIDGFRFNPTLSVGGGGDSDLVYELQPELQYNFTDLVAGRLGYRRVHYEYDGKHDSEIDIDYSGLIIGVGVTF